MNKFRYFLPLVLLISFFLFPLQVEHLDQWCVHFFSTYTVLKWMDQFPILYHSVHYAYRITYLPMIFLSGIASLFFLLSFFVPSFSKRRNLFLLPSLMICLHLFVNVGVIGHLFFKDHWSRPRPQKTSLILQEGGVPYQSPYRYSFSQKHTEKGHDAFPSGHTIGSLFPWILISIGMREKKKRWQHIVCFGSILFAILVSIQRISTNSHFFSDIYAAWILMTLSPLWIEWFVDRYLQKKKWWQSLVS